MGWTRDRVKELLVDVVENKKINDSQYKEIKQIIENLPSTSNSDDTNNNIIELQQKQEEMLQLIEQLRGFHNLSNGENSTDSDATLAFPSAYGASAYTTTGARGLNVYHVTNLNNSGAGSFRDAVSVGNRTILFDVSGTINLTTDLYITVDNLTIAGQSAPQGGIAITGKNVFIQDNDNLVMRYMRFRPVYNSSGTVDALNAYNVTNMIFDHVSVSWGGDEAFSITGNSQNITVQKSILGESATGMILGSLGVLTSDNFSILKNLFYNISHRFPNPTTGRVDVINNVVHNWNSRLMVAAHNDGVQLNEINNYYQSGTNTQSPTAVLQSVNWLDIGSASQRPNIRVHTNGNVFSTFSNGTNDNWNAWVHRFNVTSGAYAGYNQGDTPSLDFRETNPFTQAGRSFTPDTAASSLSDVQNNGANKYLNNDGSYGIYNDSVDTIYLTNVSNNTSESYSYPPTNIVNKQSYIDYQNAISSTPINTREGTFYISNAHIPEIWFTANVPNGEDHNGIAPSGYTWLEVYLNQVDI